MSIATGELSAAAPARPSTSVPAALDGYRPHLDGMRTVAVYLVVVFHAGVARFSGGFIGVDVFFVLSGYLVTQVLMRDLVAHQKVRFGRFYARRFRRLLPAATMALIGTAVVYSWVASPVEVTNAIDGFRASFLYVANWFFVSESTDYFAAGQASSPVLHFWSLAVEEQFYLLWPLILAGLIAVTKWLGSRSWTAVRILVALAGASSLAWAWHLSASSPSHAYYGTDTRAYQLLAGALVAMTPSLLTRARGLDLLAAPVALLSVAGLVIASTDVVDGRPVARGVVACVLTVALIVSLERGGGPAGNFLSWKPMVELGRISYGTYLWHWPVIVIVGRLADFGPWQMAAVAAVLSSGLAALSAMVVEHPIRLSARLDRMPRAVVAWGLTTSVVFGLVLIRPVAEASDGATATEPAAATSAVDHLLLTPVPDDFDEVAIQEEGFGEVPACQPATGEGCTLVEGDGPHVVLIGDSTAVMLAGAMQEVAEAEGLTLTLAADPGCAWQSGYFYASHPDKQDHCQQIHERVYGEVLDELDPDLVVAVGVREWSTFSRPDFDDAPEQQSLRSTTAVSVERILASGARLAVIEPMPRGPRDPNPLNCLAMARYLEECRFSSSTEPYWVERDLRDLASRNERMWSVDLDRLVCPALPMCDAMLDGVVVHWDDAHITRRFGLTLAEPLGEELRSRGLLDP